MSVKIEPRKNSTRWWLWHAIIIILILLNQAASIIIMIYIYIASVTFSNYIFGLMNIISESLDWESWELAWGFSFRQSWSQVLYHQYPHQSFPWKLELQYSYLQNWINSIITCIATNIILAKFYHSDHLIL